MRIYNRYIEGLTYSLPHPLRAEADRLELKFDTDAFVEESGVVRWKTNNNVPPSDVLEFWKSVGKMFDIEKSVIIREKETQDILTAYRKQMENVQPTEEELFEMRAAFGEGAEVVNVITGRKTIL